jgi:hypothetical protein
MKKMKISLAAVLLFAAIFSVTSCKKERAQNPTSNPGNLQDALLRKTDGGKQATVTNVAFSVPGANKNVNSAVFPSNAHMYGSSYAAWSAAWWQWAMELPAAANHPFNDDAGFDVTMGQSGNVWFLATAFGTVTRSCTIPSGKALYVGLLNTEASDLEGLGSTYAERFSTANWLADHIVPASLSFTVDGSAVNINSYRFTSPEFTFSAPTPWIYGATGGNGTSVGDGYYVMVKPLSAGSHILHCTGAFHFTLADDGFDFDASADMTYNITVQ